VIGGGGGGGVVVVPHNSTLIHDLMPNFFFFFFVYLSRVCSTHLAPRSLQEGDGERQRELSRVAVETK
jgi:hypothetical protein